MSRHQLSHRLLQRCRCILFTHFTWALAILDMRHPGNYSVPGSKTTWQESTCLGQGKRQQHGFHSPQRWDRNLGSCSSGEITSPAGCGSTLSRVSLLYEHPQDRDARAAADLPNIQGKNSPLNHQLSMPGAERVFVAKSILVPFYWENIIHVNMDLYSAISNLEPDLSLTSFPSSVLIWWQTLGVGSLGSLHLFLASGAALCVHPHQKSPGSCWADLGPTSSGALSPPVPAGGGQWPWKGVRSGCILTWQILQWT